MTTVYVIMGNDYPAGVMDDKDAAEKLCEARMQRQKDSMAKNQYAPRIYWRTYPFELNAIK